MVHTGSEALLSPLRYDPLQLHEDPYPLYRRLRDEAPVYRSEERDCWVLSRYEDVQAAARDWETFRNGEGNTLDHTGELFAPAGEVTHADPPLHGRLRDAVRKEFGVSMVRENLEPAVRAKVRRLIGDLRGREQVDLAEELALVLPGGMVCGWLGFPERDHAQLLAWFGAMTQRTPGCVELPESAFTGRDHMRAYLKDAIAARRKRPRPDLLSMIVGAVADGKLSEDEAIGIAMLLFFAGIATTSALIASSLLNLSNFEPQLQRLRAAPETIPTAVEELLRFDAPIQWLTRVTTQDVELHETAIPAGARVLLLWGSANRDERRWEHPDELDLTRAPKRHISFGEGIHHCLGAPLARLEAKVLLEELLPQIAAYEITRPVKRPYSEGDRAISSLPARVQWAGRR
jgi:cytochrome P450